MNEVLDSNNLILCFAVVFFSFKNITVVYIPFVLKVLLTFSSFHL